MKKILIAILVSIALLPTMTYAQSTESKIINNNNVELTITEYNKLIEMGFTDSQIMFFNQEAINRNLKSNAELVHKNVSYLKTIYTYENNLSTYSNYWSTPVVIDEVELTKEQYELETSNDNNISTNASEHEHYYKYRTLTTSLYKEGTYSEPVYRIVNIVQWADGDGPDTRSFDISGITFDTNEITIKSVSQYAFQTYTQTHKITGSSEYKTVNYSTGSDHYTKTNEGYAISMNLVDDTTWYKMHEMNSYLEYTVIKSGSNTINTLQFKGTYVHSNQTVDLLDVVGFAMDPSATGLAMFLLGNPISSSYDSGNKTLVQVNDIGW